jgi:hypothetical protein
MAMYHEFRNIQVHGLSRTDDQAAFHELCSIQCFLSFTLNVNVENINMFLELKPYYHIQEEMNKDILCRCKKLTGTDNVRNSQFTSYLLETLEVTD